MEQMGAEEHDELDPEPRAVALWEHLATARKHLEAEVSIAEILGPVDIEPRQSFRNAWTAIPLYEYPIHGLAWEALLRANKGDEALAAKQQHQMLFEQLRRANTFVQAAISLMRSLDETGYTLAKLGKSSMEMQNLADGHRYIAVQEIRAADGFRRQLCSRLRSLKTMHKLGALGSYMDPERMRRLVNRHG